MGKGGLIEVPIIIPTTDKEIVDTSCGILQSKTGKIVGRYFIFAGYANVECLLCDFTKRIRGSTLTRDLKNRLISHVRQNHPGI